MSKFLSNWIVKNILLAVLAVILLAVAADFVLARLTNHNKVISVPDMTNMTVTEARRTAANHDLKAVVTDSVFVRRMQKGAVYSQNPKAGASVKKGRKIRLTINAMQAKKVTMPNLVEVIDEDDFYGIMDRATGDYAKVIIEPGLGK